MDLIGAKMIKFVKLVDYYQKKKPLKSTESKKQDFAIFEDAFNALINEELNQVINNKDITAIETCYILYKDNPGHYKKITKTIDPNNPNEYIIK